MAVEGARSIDELRRDVAAEPTRREPRRALARALREAKRYANLVDALREEEQLGCATTADRIEVLLELAEVCRVEQRNDAGAATALRRALDLQPDDLTVLDRLATLFEALKQWRDLASLLGRRAQHVADP